jgi:hypothetical protein
MREIRQSGSTGGCWNRDYRAPASYPTLLTTVVPPSLFTPNLPSHPLGEGLFRGKPAARRLLPLRPPTRPRRTLELDSSPFDLPDLCLREVPRIGEDLFRP